MTSPNEYDLNDSAYLTAEFTSGSVAVDPTTVLLKIQDPDKIVTNVVQGSMDNPAVGTWAYLQTLNKVGQWRYRFEGSGNIIAAAEKCLIVDPSEFD